jgi:TIR domain
MPEEDDSPVFPFEPTEVKTSRFRVLQYGDFQSEKDIQRLFHLLWLEPECTISYDFEKNGSIDVALQRARDRGNILMSQMQRQYFAHPHFERDYILIRDRGGEYAWDWEREVVEKGPKYWQVRLELQPRKVAELDAWRKVHLEEAYREQLRTAKCDYDVFLSYAEGNRAEAELLHEKVVAASGKIFMAPKVLAPGDDFAEEICAALERSRELWLLASPASAKSEWVIPEWGAAWVLM